MKKVSITLSQLLTLDAELAGVYNQSTGEQLLQGFLSLELDFVLKYHLSKIHAQVAEEKKNIEKFREDLIKKFGEEDAEGNWSIPYQVNVKKDEKGEVISSDINPKFEEFSKEFERFLGETVELSVKDLSVDSFSGVKLKSAPTVLFSILTEDK